MSSPPMTGLRVIEAASGVAGPMAAVRLGDLGADVVKIEWADGDWMRTATPVLADGTSAAFFALNRGKRSVRLDDGGDAQRLQLRRLVESADVLMADEAGRALLGLSEMLDSDGVYRANRKLIIADISALGAKGPLAGKPGSELGAQAMAGYTRYVSAADQPPARLGADVGGASTAIFATQAILAALIARKTSGHGQTIDLSLLNSLLAMKTVHLAAQSDPDVYEGPRVGGAYDPPERGWKTADAPVTFAFGGAVGAEGRPGWTQFVEAMGLSRMLHDPRFDKTGRQTTGLGPKARELKAEYEAEFVKRPSAEVVGAVRQFGGFASAYLSHAELMQEPQVAALGIVREVDGGDAQAVRVLDFPARFSTLAPALSGRAPKLGEHTDEIMREFAGAADAAAAKSKKTARSKQRQSRGV